MFLWMESQLLKQPDYHKVGILILFSFPFKMPPCVASSGGHSGGRGEEGDGCPPTNFRLAKM